MMKSDEIIGFAFQLSTSEHMIQQAAYLPASGVGVNGTFFIKGALSLEGQSLFVSAMGFTAAQRMGNVHFHALVKVEVNGEAVFSAPLQPGQGEEVWPIEDYMPIGSATLVLPTPRPDNIVQIVITGGYTYSAAGGQAVPIPSVGSTTIPLEILKVQ